ncbi:hypothetical protein GGI43DRAFT_257779 [Trichoderma evansii]
MGDKQQLDTPAEKLSEGQALMNQLWIEAAEYFKETCGESLQNGKIKGLDDVEKEIMSIHMKTADGDGNQEQDKWKKTKEIGLTSLKYLKMLVGAASSVAPFVPIPDGAVNIISSALCFVFNIPEAIKSYNDAIDKVFSDVSSALCQFRIFKTIDNIDILLVRQIHLVLVSVVKVCAHVVKYRQGRKRDRFLQQVKSIFEDSGLAERMKDFKQALQQQRDIEGTITLAVAMETKQGIAILQEQSLIVGETTEETLLVAQETQKGVQTLTDDADRMKTLIKIRDTLGVEPTVRLDTNTTQTCTDIAAKCLDGTGSWIWEHEAYVAWTQKENSSERLRLLFVYGPPSSGKTLVSALVTKRLEEQRGRAYVAHYFFPPRITKSDNEKDTIQMALKYMAFQIARVDVALQKVLGKACNEELSTIRHPENLSDIWKKLKIGITGPNTVYYLVFDGIENLPDQQADMLLEFIFSLQSARESSERVRILVSGTEDQYIRWSAAKSAHSIKIDDYNSSDMRIIIDNALSQRGMLQHTKPGSDQQKAKDKILEKLPQKVKGSYSRLQFGLDDVIRLLSKRSAARELDRMLDQSISSHEAAIKNLQRSLTADEISELNELLKWALFSRDNMTLDQLEAAMFLYSGEESLASLHYIIKNKYSAVLKIDDCYIYGQDGVKDYLRKERVSSGQSLSSKDRPTISMTITINNVDQETCGHFLWDLAHKAIRDKFSFNVDGDTSNTLSGSNWGTIDVDEFDAHYTIVTRAFDYLSKPHSRDETKEIGKYIASRLPYHLNCLRQLEDEDKGALMPSQHFNIGQNLYELFRNEEVFMRHKESFEKLWWTVEEMENVQKWLMDSAVMRKLPDRKWRDEIQSAMSPARGYLKHFAKFLIRSFLKERSWDAYYAYKWIEQLIEADEKKSERRPELSNTSEGSFKETDWSRISTWCQNVLGLNDSELNSLWYERLAEAYQHSDLDTTLSLYKRAIEEQNPSWLCYRGLGISYHKKGQIQDAITQLQFALERTEQEDVQPRPEAKDTDELYLLLGQYTYESGDMASAKKYYLLVSKTSQRASGHLKVMLSSPEAEEIQQFLSTSLAQDDLTAGMATALRDIARDPQHEFLISRMLTAAKRDSNLLRGTVKVIQIASETPVPNEGHACNVLDRDGRFIQDEIRGVLLCDQGYAEYLYGVSEKDNESINEALRLWTESRDQLSNVGGSKALSTRQRVTTALANHYFQNIFDNIHLHQDGSDALAKLTTLANSDSDSYDFYSNSKCLLSAALVLCNKKELARDILVNPVRQVLQILSDDIPENDQYGFALMLTISEQYNDFTNAAIALALYGQPDIVTEALYFDIGHITEVNEKDKEPILDAVVKLAKKIIQVAKTQVPDSTKQMQRIQAAKLHIDSLLAAAKDRVRLETNGDDEDVKPGVRDLVAAHALRMLESRLPRLYFRERSFWSCDGLTPDGKACGNSVNFETDFYDCIYCSNQSFCGDCLKRLRDPNYDMGIMECSGTHKWLHIPKHGDDMYVGLTAKSVRVPSHVKALDEDDRILKIYYAEDGGGKEITVEEWKESLREIWGIPPEST